LRSRAAEAGRKLHTLSDFKRNTAAFVRNLRRSGQPAILTVNGQPRLVVQAADAYQRLLDLVERADAIDGIQGGLAAFDQGRGVPALEALEAMRKKHGIPRPR